MRNELLRKYDWKDIPYLTGNSKLEVNLFQDIPKLLAKMMPDYDFGIFTYDDMDHRRSLGWEPLPPEKLGTDWKAKAPLGFVSQFSDHGGYLTIKGKILCYMPKEIRKVVRKQVMDKAEARYLGASKGVRADAQSKVNPRTAVEESELEVQTQLPGEGPVTQTPKKVGRPRKNG